MFCAQSALKGKARHELNRLGLPRSRRSLFSPASCVVAPPLGATIYPSYKGSVTAWRVGEMAADFKFGRSFDVGRMSLRLGDRPRLERVRRKVAPSE